MPSCLALPLLAAWLALPLVKAHAPVRNAALQVSASDGTTEAEAIRVEARLFNSVQPVLEKRGFALSPLGPLHDTRPLTVASGATLEELEVEVQKRAGELLAGQR